jgi:DNA adenine methylase
MTPNTTNTIDGARPFLKWAGGKSQLLKQYGPYFPEREGIQCYFEPFLGSGAVFFHLQPRKAVLADINEKLVETYQVVQQDVESLIDILGQYRNEEEEFYRVRAQNPVELDMIERAARLIYLNKTCYNGLYRENKKGEFNVPFGRYKNPAICNPLRLRTASKALDEVHLKNSDYDEVVDSATPGDFVYFDPPYVPLSATSNFTSYNRHGFGMDDQKCLADTFDRLTSERCAVMLSNSNTPQVRELYGGKGYRLIEVEARRFINSKAARRGPVTELLILNY